MQAIRNTIADGPALRRRGFDLRAGDVVEQMAKLPHSSVDVIFADPPYFLSGEGSTCKSGKRAPVAKAHWDRPMGPEAQLEWARAWLDGARHVLRPTGSIWITGTLHSVHTVGYALALESFRLLNEVVWEKPNPPPNLGCRCFTHSHETLLWASLGKDRKHVFNYELMKGVNNGKQMKDVWQFTAPKSEEKLHGRHPTQKPVSVVGRCLLASMPQGGTVLDPFMGSGTTGVAVARVPQLEWKFIGVELDPVWVNIARQRILEATGATDSGSP